MSAGTASERAYRASAREFSSVAVTIYCADLSIARDLDKEGIWRLGRIASSGSGSQGARAPGNAAQGSSEGVLSCLKRVCTLVPGEQSADRYGRIWCPADKGADRQTDLREVVEVG